MEVLAFRQKLLLASVIKARRRVLRQAVAQGVGQLPAFQLGLSQFAESGPLLRCDSHLHRELVGSSSRTGVAKIWDRQTLQLKHQLSAHKDKVTDIKFNPCLGLSERGPNVATSSCDSMVRLWTLEPERLQQKSLQLAGHEGRVNRVVFSSEGSFLVSGSDDCNFIVWDLTTAKQVYSQSYFRRGVLAIDIHPDGSLLFAADLLGEAGIWDLRSGKLIFGTRIGTKVNNAHFGPSGTVLALAADDNSVHLLQLRRLPEEQRLLGHTSIVSDAIFVKDGLVSSSFDCSIRGWRNGENTFSLSTGESKVTCLAGAGEVLLASSLDQNLSVYWGREVHLN